MLSPSNALSPWNALSLANAGSDSVHPGSTDIYVFTLQLCIQFLRPFSVALVPVDELCCRLGIDLIFKATFTLHRYSFRPLHFCYGSSASTLYRIKTVPLPFPVYTVPGPFNFLLRACPQHVSHCMQGRKFALKSRQNTFNVCLRKRRHLEYILRIELQCTVLDVNQYWFCCSSKRLHCAGTLWIRTVRFRSRIKTVPVGRIRIVPVPQDYCRREAYQ